MEDAVRRRMEALVILDGLADGVAFLGEDGGVLFGNEALETLLGRSRPELLDRSAREWLHPDQWHELERALDRDPGSGPSSFEARVSGPDGRWEPVEALANRMVLEGASGLVLSLRGLRGRSTTGDELRRERNYLRTLLEQVEVGIAACDAEGRVVLYNPTFASYHPTPPAGQTLQEWLSQYRFFKADGITPQPWADAPLARALRGEPVRNHEYAVLGKEGELEYRRASGTRLYDGEGRVIGAVVALHDITDQRRSEDAMRRQSLHDALTGLANRALLFDRVTNALARAERHRSRMSVFFVDLDNFKLINDGLGHATGDRVLVEVARRLVACLRPGDTVARLGGDEFVILCEEIEDGDDENAIAQRVCRTVAEPAEVDGRLVRVTASVGVRRAAPGDSPEALLRDADAAMYLAKERGRNRFEAWDGPLRARALQLLEVEQTLLRVMSNDGLRLVFQPIVSADAGRLVGMEALVRCYDPETGTLAPGKFIPVAEAMGVVDRIDRWVLDQVCRHARMLLDAAPDRRIFVGCNLSSRLISQEGLGELVEGALRRHGVPADRLGLELTETALIQATPETRRTLARIRDAGTFVGIDDFGKGYSSLTWLRDFPVSFIKIDRSFVNGLGMDRSDAAIIEAVVRLAHALSLTVTAEGVEYIEQAERLRTIGCDHLQGYLISRPIPAEALVMMARAQASGSASWSPLFWAMEGGLARSAPQVA
jgi:diguanylate cyclase (GGDEF)-like protein/PAS domain S-box-containing protein